MSTKEGHTRLWGANLTDDLSKEQIIHLFEKYGSVHNIVRKGSFAMIEYENASEALRAKRGLDSVDYHGRRLNMDWYRGDKYGSMKLDGKNWWGGISGHPRYKHRVIVLGIPNIWGYQDVLNLAWSAGFSVVFIDIATSRWGFVYGVIEFAHYEDYKYALEYLDGTQLRVQGEDTKTLRFIKADELPSVERHVAQKKNVHGVDGQPPPPHPPHPPHPRQHPLRTQSSKNTYPVPAPQSAYPPPPVAWPPNYGPPPQ